MIAEVLVWIVLGLAVAGAVGYLCFLVLRALGPQRMYSGALTAQPEIKLTHEQLEISLARNEYVVGRIEIEKFEDTVWRALNGEVGLTPSAIPGPKRYRHPVFSSAAVSPPRSSGSGSYMD